jgi:hypothetical protein
VNKRLFFKNVLTLLLPLLITSGCQEEVVEIDEPSPEEVVTVNSTVTGLLLRVALKDGSGDNIIDDASCVSVLFPITVVVNGQEITLNSEEDLSKIETIFDQSEDDDNTLIINFPIPVIFSNYLELTVADQAALEDLKVSCEEGEDDDIECLDFKYPIDLSIYDSNKQTADVITINNDKEMFQFFETLEESDLVGFEFPLALILFDGREIEVNDNIELEKAIEDSIDDCDEDDDPEDDDITILEIETILVSGDWLITQFSDTTDETISFNDFKLIFNPVGSILAQGELGGNFGGEWNINFSDDEQSFTLAFDFDTEDPPFVWLDVEWNIITFSQTKIEMKAESETDGFERMMTIEKK